jgi:hypothetical protein
MSRNEDSAYDRARHDHILDVAITRANIEANMRPRICPFHKIEIPTETQECQMCAAELSEAHDELCPDCHCEAGE